MPLVEYGPLREFLLSVPVRLDWLIMPCYPFRENGEFAGFICGELEAEQCSECGAIADTLCDYPVGDGKTCDRLMCEDHAHLVAPDVHYCHGHYEQWKAWRKENGEIRVLKNVVPFRGA